MEHPNGFTIFYLLLLVAHYIPQLILHGNLVESLRKTFGSARKFAKRLAESMRTDPDPIPRHRFVSAGNPAAPLTPQSGPCKVNP